jgi:sulfonate transport system ATP-binding protein
MIAHALRRLDDRAAPHAVRTGARTARTNPSAATSITLRGLAKTFGDNKVLSGIDLHVPAGQFVAIVGKSGCGKSTLLRLIVGLDQPTDGRLWLGDRPDAVCGGGSRRIMFQEPRLLPWARVVDNVAVGLGEAGSRGEQLNRARAALDQVGLAAKADVWPATLSGGQRQRVALARALVSRPQLLALDEPLGALDALTRIDMQALVEGVWRTQGFTAVLVTHDVSEAVALADRILVMEEGRIALDLSVEAPRPRHRGDPALAALEGRILDHLFRDAAAAPIAAAA